MNPLGLALIAGGLALVAVGLLRVRAPWGRYQALRAREANAERYRAWRGGPGGAGGEGKTGASVAMAMLRREARTWAAVAAVGVGLVVVGLVLGTG